MAMSKLNLPVYPWLMAQESPQLDFIQDLTKYDQDFEYVSCKYYSNPFVYSFRGLPSVFLRKVLINIFSLLPGKADFLAVTPYVLHFGWLHQKQPFFEFTERVWNRLKKERGFQSAEIDIHKLSIEQ